MRTGDEPKLKIRVPVVEMVQVKFPRSKKKRIRKKWAKNKGNFTVREGYLDMESQLCSDIGKALGVPRRRFEVGAKLELYGRQNQSQAGA